ncbi:dTMP kinase [Vandammella animalimorsus]|uniref:Thymidylate kinase n=1 Tax=Vandammella animalimorsus TaxID=2029117 RepID=A0A2A2AVW4_9BURK|nr:dTMP kinase [Vandammella animalimorsus]PAT41799.1 dTMP kinase [Vandammella animalimorsus]
MSQASTQPQAHPPSPALLPARRGWFISVEGIDGAGKSAHLEAMAQALRAQGQSVLCTREPGGTPLGERLRELLLHERMDALSETLLAFAARREHLLQVIAPALRQGTTVLCDRFTDATFAYQGGGRSQPWAWIEQLQAWVQGGHALPPPPANAHALQTDAAEASACAPSGLLQPDCTLWFDLPPAVAAQRLRQARTPDRFEREAQAFFERVAQGYARCAAEHPGRFVRIHADAPLAQVQAEVLAALRARGLLAPAPQA